MFKRKFKVRIFNGEQSLPLKGSIVGALEFKSQSDFGDDAIGQIIYRLDDPRDLRMLANLLESWKDLVKIE